MDKEFRKYWSRLARPMPAAVIFCALGLTSALLVVTFNRGVALQSPQPLPPVSASATPSPTASATPAFCNSASPLSGSLDGAVVTQDALVQITDGAQTVSVGIPSGIEVSGSADDVKVVAPIPQTKPKRATGTVVSNTPLCVATSQGQGVVSIAAGEQASGQVISSSKGLLVVGMEFKATVAAPPPPGNGAGDGGD